jgi:hypothetical protein
MARRSTTADGRLVTRAAAGVIAAFVEGSQVLDVVCYLSLDVVARRGLDQSPAEGWTQPPAEGWFPRVGGMDVMSAGGASAPPEDGSLTVRPGVHRGRPPRDGRGRMMWATGVRAG